jgi:hypothetical protein
MSAHLTFARIGSAKIASSVRSCLAMPNGITRWYHGQAQAPASMLQRSRKGVRNLLRPQKVLDSLFSSQDFSLDAWQVQGGFGGTTVSLLERPGPRSRNHHSPCGQPANEAIAMSRRPVERWIISPSFGHPGPHRSRPQHTAQHLAGLGGRLGRTTIRPAHKVRPLERAAANQHNGRETGDGEIAFHVLNCGKQQERLPSLNRLSPDADLTPPPY